MTENKKTNPTNILLVVGLVLFFGILVLINLNCGEKIDLPEYVVLDETKLMSGKVHADILIKSFSRKTPIKKREETIKAISNEKGFDELALYSTEEAKKANYSGSFQKEHPNALKTGYLGSYKYGIFTPGETHFP